MKPYIFFAAAATIGLATACQSAPVELAKSSAHVVDTGTGEGLFYPPVTETETRSVRFGAMTGASPEQRQYFTDRVNMETSGRGLTMPFIVQSTGVDQDVLVVMVSGFDEPLTSYISRGLLARMTSITRFAPTIAEMGLSQELDVYDVAAVLGFTQIVITDGREVSYGTKLESDFARY